MNRFPLSKLRTIIAKLKEPRRLTNYFGTQLAYHLKLIRVPFTPPRIDLEPNNTCNLRCRHCQVTHWSKPAVHLDMPAFNRVLSRFPGLLSVKLQGMGEPLLNRDLAAMLLEGESRGISMQFISNGTILDSATADKLLQLKRTHIGFSLDGATAETFESVRTGASFDKVVANIRELTRRRGKRVFPLISVTTVVTSNNLHEIPALVRLAKELGVDSINLQTALTNWGKEEIDEYNETIRVSPRSVQVETVFQEARRIAAELHVDLKIWREDYYTKRHKCPWPWTRVFVAANGDVVPCCILADSDTIRMGNLFEQSFAEIWNSPQYRDFRQRIKSHRLHEFCKNCYRE